MKIGEIWIRTKLYEGFVDGAFGVSLGDKVQITEIDEGIIWYIVNGKYKSALRVKKFPIYFTPECVSLENE